MSQAIQISADFRLDFSQRHTLEANDFALRLLMPEAALRYALEVMQACDVQELAHVFAVPVLLVKQRLSELGLPLPRVAVRPAATLTIELE